MPYSMNLSNYFVTELDYISCLTVTPGTAAWQASLSFTISQSPRQVRRKKTQERSEEDEDWGVLWLCFAIHIQAFRVFLANNSLPTPQPPDSLAFKDACFPWRPNRTQRFVRFQYFTRWASFGKVCFNYLPIISQPRHAYNLEAVITGLKKGGETLVFIIAHELTWDISPARHLKDHLLRALLVHNPPRTSHFCQQAALSASSRHPHTHSGSQHHHLTASFCRHRVHLLNDAIVPTHLSDQLRCNEMAQQ